MAAVYTVQGRRNRTWVRRGRNDLFHLPARSEASFLLNVFYFWVPATLRFSDLPSALTAGIYRVYPGWEKPGIVTSSTWQRTIELIIYLPYSYNRTIFYTQAIVTFYMKNQYKSGLWLFSLHLKTLGHCVVVSIFRQAVLKSINLFLFYFLSCSKILPESSL